MTKKEFKKTVQIYRSHNLKNGFISITFAYILNETCKSVSKTVEIEKFGGALNSLYLFKCLNKS